MNAPFNCTHEDVTALSQHAYTHDQLTSVYRDAEQDILQRFFQEEYSQNLKMYDLANHIAHMAEQYGLQDVEVYKDCMQGLHDFSYQYGALRNGEKGEWLARRALNWVGIPHETLQGIELQYEGEPNEYDDVVITPKGIFIIEVKYSTTDTLIDPAGNYKSKTKRTFGAYNLGEQMQSKSYVLWQTIAPAVNQFLTRDQIHCILLYANNNSTVEDRFQRIPICHCSDINYYLEDFSSDAPDLTAGQILEIKNAILAAESKTAYSIDLDFNKLNADLTEMTALIEAAAQPSSDSPHGFEESPVTPPASKSKWTFDWRSALIGSAAVVLGGLAVKGCRTLLAAR